MHVCISGFVAATASLGFMRSKQKPSVAGERKKKPEARGSLAYGRLRSIGIPVCTNGGVVLVGLKRPIDTLC